MWVDRQLTPERRRFLRFAIVGASGVVVNLAFVALGLWLFAGVAEETRDHLASALGIAVSVLTNFALNDAWTWGDRKKGKRRRDFAARMGAYYLAAGVAAGLQYGVAALLRAGLDANIYLAQLAGIALATAVQYFFNNVFVFRDQGRDGQGAGQPRHEREDPE